MVAIELASKKLLNGECDIVIAGGVEVPCEPKIGLALERIGFLPRSTIRPFDVSANGFFLSEGGGFLVLKRLADAHRDGDRIYAVIQAVGCSNNQIANAENTSLLACQVKTLQAVYEHNGIDPQSVSLIEAHGLGISLSDQTELEALTHLFGKRSQGRFPSCAIGVVKSMIGHCLAASGFASIIKTTLALHHKILPSTLCDEVNSKLNIEKTPFYINTESRPWIHGNKNVPRRAGVSAFGCTGIIGHLIMEECKEHQAQDLKLISRKLPSELLCFSGNSLQQLMALVKDVLRYTNAHPNELLANLAYTLSLSTRTLGRYRLAVIAKDIPDLQVKLRLVIDKLSNLKQTQLHTPSGIFYADTHKVTLQGKSVFLYPGQGSQYLNVLADLCLYLPGVREWFDNLDRTYYGIKEHLPSTLIFPPPTGLTSSEQQVLRENLNSMEGGAQVGLVVSLALNELLQDLNVECDVMVGYSNGEHVALITSGTWRVKDKKKDIFEAMSQITLETITTRADLRIPTGVMLAVSINDRDVLQEIIEAFAGRIYLAMDNCPHQVVLCGSEGDIDEVTKQLRKAGAICICLPFDRAYHTPLFEEKANDIRPVYDDFDIVPGHIPLYSCVTTEPFPKEPKAIRDLAAKQFASRVRFRETILRLYEEEVRIFIEVGSGGKLTGFVNDTLRGREYLAIASNLESQSGLEQVQKLVAQLYVKGNKAINLTPFFRNRELSLVSLSTVSPPSKVTELVDEKWDSNVSQERVQPAMVETAHKNLLFESKQEVISNVSAAGSPSSAINSLHTHTSENPTNDKLGVLLAHFDLMQEFLASQVRICSSLFDSRVTENVNYEEQPSLVSTTSLTRSNEQTWPLLSKVIEQDATHLYCECSLNLERNLFLSEHTLGGKECRNQPELTALSVVPFTFSMEILAEAASCFMGGHKQVINLSNVRGYQWLALDDGSLNLSVFAELKPQSEEGIWDIHVQLFEVSIEKQTTKRQLVFEGDVKLAEQFPESPSPVPIQMENFSPPKWGAADFYEYGLFHGPSFQSIECVQKVGKQGIEANLRVPATHNLFQDVRQPILQIPATLLDAAGQLVGYWLAERSLEYFGVFPFQIRAFHQYRTPLSASSPLVCYGSTEFTNQIASASFDFIDTAGQVTARIEGMQLKYFDYPKQYFHCLYWPSGDVSLSNRWMEKETRLVCRRIDSYVQDFLNGGRNIWKRALAHVVLNENEKEFWYKLPEKGSRRGDWLLGRVAAKDALRQWAKENFGMTLAPTDIEILPNELGKPLITCPKLEKLAPIPDMSISHCGGSVVAALGTANTHIGIDIENFDIRQVGEWLQSAFTLQELTFVPPDDQRTLLGLWSAKEAAAKAMGIGLQGTPRRWQITDVSIDKHNVIIAYGNESLEVSLQYQGAEVFAVCQIPKLVVTQLPHLSLQVK